MEKQKLSVSGCKNPNYSKNIKIQDVFILINKKMCKLEEPHSCKGHSVRVHPYGCCQKARSFRGFATIAIVDAFPQNKDSLPLTVINSKVSPKKKNYMREILADKRILQVFPDAELLPCTRLYGVDHRLLWQTPMNIRQPKQMMDIEQIASAGFIILVDEKCAGIICDMFTKIGSTKEIANLKHINLRHIVEENALDDVGDHTIKIAKTCFLSHYYDDNQKAKFKNTKHKLYGQKLDFKTGKPRAGKESVGTFFGKPVLYETAGQTAVRECQEESRITFTEKVLECVKIFCLKGRVFFLCDLSDSTCKITRLQTDNILIESLYL